MNDDHSQKTPGEDGAIQAPNVEAKPKINLPNIPKVNKNPFGASKPIIPKIQALAAPETSGIEEDSSPTEAMSIDELYAMENNSAIFMSPGVRGEQSEEMGNSHSIGELGDGATEMEEVVELDDIEPIEDIEPVEVQPINIQPIEVQPLDDGGPATDNLSAEDLSSMVIPPMADDAAMHVVDSGNPFAKTPGLMTESSSASQEIADPMEEEATSLLSMSDGILLEEDSNVDLDEFEEEGATIVFDSFTGQDIASLDKPSNPSSGGLQAPQIQSSFNQQAQGPWSPTASSPSLRAPDPQVFEQQPSALQDDFSSQATEVLNSPFQREHLTPKLRFMQGPYAGQDAFIRGIKGTFGRGENNTNMIPDMAMSRHHFEIVKQPDESYLVRDLGSSNGTTLNGTLIKEAALFHGDRLEAGKSLMEFDYEEAVAKPHRHLLKAETSTLQGHQLDDKTTMAALQIDQTTRLLTRISIAAGILCVPLLGLLLVMSLRDPKPKATTTPPTQNESQKSAAQLYLKGVDAVKNRDWDLARSHFKRAQASDAKLNIKAQLDLIQREQLAQKAFNRAQTLAKANKQDEVNQMVATIPQESVYFDDAQKLKRQKRRDGVQQLYQSAQAKFANDELEEAKTFAKQVLALSPEHAATKKLIEDIEKRELALKKEAEKANEQANNNTKEPEVNPFDKPAKTNTTIAVNNSGGSLQDGLALYQKGQFSQAVKAFEGVSGSKASRLAKSARQMQTSYRAGKSAFNKKQWSKAISQLNRAKHADSALGKAFSRDISSMLATSYAEQGLAYVKKNKFRDARKSLVAGKRHQSNSKIRELSSALENKARSLYIKAVNTKKSNADAAETICRQIMLMVPSTSPTWKKARRLMLEF